MVMLTCNVSIADHPQGHWCPVCMDSWIPEMVPVRIKVYWHYETICGQCAEAIGKAAQEERERRKRESEAVRGIQEHD